MAILTAMRLARNCVVLVEVAAANASLLRWSLELPSTSKSFGGTESQTSDVDFRRLLRTTSLGFLIMRTCRQVLVSDDSDRFKGLTIAHARSLGAHARNFSVVVNKIKLDPVGATRAPRHRFVLVVTSFIL